jgi:hypothetical protein
MADRKTRRQFLHGVASSIVALVSVCAPAHARPWAMQPVPIATRWASEVRPDHVLPDYPRPHMVRSEWQVLNGLWNYAITDAHAPAPARWDGEILVPYPVESALSGVKRSLKPDQALWYERSFRTHAGRRGERVLLHFGAVDSQARVWVNGRELGEHAGGYQRFSFDITDALHPNGNRLTVKVIDPTDTGIHPTGKQALRPGGIFYTASSGIWQTVWLERVPSSYIARLKTLSR